MTRMGLQRAHRLLRHAFEHLRPLMVADTQKGIAANAEALAGSSIAKAQVTVAGLQRAARERAIRIKGARHGN